MSTDRDLTRIVRSWLHEDAHEDADRLLDLVLDEIDTTPQRRAPWLARRFPIMNSNFGRVALAAAVVIGVVGFQYISNSNTGGPGATPTPQPTATPESSGAAPTSLAAVELPAGSSHVLWDTPGDIRISVTIPASGWFGGVGRGFIIKPNNPAPPVAGVLVWQGPLYVYGDRCHWATTPPETPATTVLEIVEALMAQTPDDGGSPLSVSLGGYSGVLIKLHVPEDAVFADCDRGEFRSWVGDPVADNARYHQGPGQDDYVWVIDVNGTPVILDVGNFYQTLSATREEMDAIVHSVVFELP